jgi:hypothetical protein
MPDPSKAAHRRNPVRSYAAVAVSGSACTASPSKGFDDPGINLDAASFALLHKVLPPKKTLTVSKVSPAERRQPLVPLL